MLSQHFPPPPNSSSRWCRHLVPHLAPIINKVNFKAISCFSTMVQIMSWGGSVLLPAKSQRRYIKILLLIAALLRRVVRSSLHPRTNNHRLHATRKQPNNTAITQQILALVVPRQTISWNHIIPIIGQPPAKTAQSLFLTSISRSSSSSSSSSRILHRNASISLFSVAIILSIIIMISINNLPHLNNIMSSLRTSTIVGKLQ